MALLSTKVIYSSEQIRIEKDTLSAALSRVAVVCDELRTALTDSYYTTSYASVYLPFDTLMHTRIQERVQEVGEIDLLVVIGVGGSSLGFRAVYAALQDQATLAAHQVLVLETIDTPSVAVALERIEYALAEKFRVHVCMISKSGTTTETIALFRLVQSILQKHNSPWYRDVTIITDSDSPLDQYAQKMRIMTLALPALVGGRYSVFSAVALFPLMLCGIDIQSLLSGARDALRDATTVPLEDTITFQHAVALASWYHTGYAVHDTFIFSPWCATLGLWYRQLAAESLGKKSIKDTLIVDMIPTVSIGSTDLHSIGQLYLSGARNFCTTFIIVSEADTLKIGEDHALDQCVPLNNYSLNSVMTALIQGTLGAYQERSVPFSVITLTERSPSTIGYLMQSYMIASIYVGRLLGVNPFDQPDVERYKKITRTLLSR